MVYWIIKPFLLIWKWRLLLWCQLIQNNSKTIKGKKLKQKQTNKKPLTLVCLFILLPQAQGCFLRPIQTVFLRKKKCLKSSKWLKLLKDRIFILACSTLKEDCLKGTHKAFPLSFNLQRNWQGMPRIFHFIANPLRRQPLVFLFQQNSIWQHQLEASLLCGMVGKNIPLLGLWRLFQD